MEYKLGTLIDSVSIRHTFPNEKVVFLNTSDVEDGEVINHQETLVRTLPGQAKKTIEKDDILYSEIRPRNKRYAYIDFDADNYVVSTKLMVLRNKNREILNSKYLYYYLTSVELVNYLQNLAEARSGTFPQITFNELKNITINLPSIKFQDSVVKILESLNQKIKSNQNIITNLEELSQTLFKRWFVDFEFPDEDGNPYQSSGGEMIESELGEIPQGWEVNQFNYLCHKPISGDWGKEQMKDNYNKAVRIIRGADINEYNLGGKGKAPIRYILHKNFINKKIIPGDVVIEISGGSPTQSTGRTLLINKKVIENEAYGLVCTNFCKILRPKNEAYGEWIDYYLKYLYSRNVFFSYENGTTGIKNLDYKSLLNTMKVIIPAEQLLLKFHELISIYKTAIQNLGNEIQKLIELRDTLLPKLMSGELEILDEIGVDGDALSI
ncbi:TPA: restriction endonuclease subunit S [Staphylococcus delphini]|nr:restriction endonuclease subunit S [Staphylococcus delphini]HEC2206870.1 restriction endonuclease subunit S [Staphylococcus delphini]